MKPVSSGAIQDLLISDVKHRYHGLTEGVFCSKGQYCSIGFQTRVVDPVGNIKPSGLESLRHSYVAISGCRALILTPSSPYWNIPHGPTSSPVPLAALTEVAGLVDVVVVVVAEFGVHTIAPRTGEYLVRLLHRLLL
uniref:Uncharacterized protein n=1 Tax=Opuntia streptacantha TaxID=393608 RepID=A0A7C8YY62_OPUST